MNRILKAKNLTPEHRILWGEGEDRDVGTVLSLSLTPDGHVSLNVSFDNPTHGTVELVVADWLPVAVEGYGGCDRCNASALYLHEDDLHPMSDGSWSCTACLDDDE